MRFSAFFLFSTTLSVPKIENGLGKSHIGTTNHSQPTFESEANEITEAANTLVTMKTHNDNKAAEILRNMNCPQEAYRNEIMLPSTKTVKFNRPGVDTEHSDKFWSNFELQTRR